MNATVSNQSITELKSFQHFMSNPNSLDTIFELAEELRHSGSMAIAVDHLRSIPEVNSIIDERYLGQKYDLNTLFNLSTDSLGYIYASHMKKANLNPEFFPILDVIDDASYMSLRLRQTHDIWHVVTGFDITVAGELALLTFNLAQCHTPLPGAIIACNLLQSLSDSVSLNSFMNAITNGWNLGLSTKPLLAQKWEEGWEKPLTDWQAELGLKPLSTAV